MNAIELHQYIQHPDSLSTHSLEELKRMSEIYPYFQTAKLLYLKNLLLNKDSRFEAELKRMAIDVAERKVLYILLKGKDAFASQKEEEAQPVSDSFELIDAFLASNPQNSAKTDPTDKLLYESAMATDYFHLTQIENKAITAEPSAPEAENKLKHQDLIDSFIENETTRRRIQPPIPSEAANSNEGETEPEETPDDISIKSLDDTYFTETLARIYIKQKRYDKALQIIRNLNLKYPEKNIYFADQIRFLEKLIINTKKID